MIEILETIRDAVRKRRDDLRVQARDKEVIEAQQDHFFNARALALNDTALALSDAIERLEKESDGKSRDR